MQIYRKISVVVVLTLLSLGVAQAVPPPLPIEKTGIVEKLPSAYPESWFLVHEASFFAMSDGKVYVIDTDGDTLPEQIKGTFNVSMIGNFTQSAKRSEFYATETFHTRGTRGNRIDVVTIWDQATLAVEAEVVLPKPERFMGMPQRYTMLVLNDDKWLAIANFGPATSVTLIDLDSREIINQIPTPGCIFNYPTGKRGFSSLCADGRFMSLELDAKGQVVKQVRTDSFFSSDDSPIYDHAALVGDTLYFPSIAGLMFPVDVSGTVAQIGEPWNLVPEAERAQNWAPGGLGLIAKDDQGRVYIIMHSDAKDGSYQGGGPEVWVFDPVKKQRVKRISLKAWGLSLGVSRGENPRLMVLNPTDMSLEMYNSETGEFIKTITGFGQTSPLSFRGSE
ncbi:MAG: methylamine dehydrogenase heavy chain [Halieaceae bacterium]|jgi:methylamine dehydrogenase heavy chain